MISLGSWTVNGKVFGKPFAPPKGANDVDIYWSNPSLLLKAYWTLNGRLIQNIPVAKGTNDVHWYGYPATGGVLSNVVLTRNGQPVGTSQSPCLPATGMCANDIHLLWRPGPCRGTYQQPPVIVVWAVNGQFVPAFRPELAPCNANELELDWNSNNQVVQATWTVNGQPIAWLTPPPGANDAHIFFLGGRLLSAM